MCVFVIQFSLTINHMNLLGQCRYLIFLGESEAPKKNVYASFGTETFWRKCVVKYWVRNIGYLHLPNKCISLVNNYL